MSRITSPSLTNRPVVSASSRTPVAQRLAQKSPTPQPLIHKDGFEQGPSRSQNLRLVPTEGQKKPTPSSQTESRFEAKLERTIARVQYKKLQEQGPPQRKEFPPTLKGQVAYEKAKRDYSHELFELGVKAGYILT